MKFLQSRTLLAAFTLLLGSGASAATGAPQKDPSTHGAPPALVAKIRAATARYQDAALALSYGYKPGPCVTGPDEGAMGIHFVKEELLDDGAHVDAESPEALIYEPLPGGKLRLVAVEYITYADAWAALATVPVMDGLLFHFTEAPNRYGLPAFFELHVWAWKDNPRGTLADWNPLVSCDALPPGGT